MRFCNFYFTNSCSFNFFSQSMWGFSFLARKSSRKRVSDIFKNQYLWCRLSPTAVNKSLYFALKKNNTLIFLASSYPFQFLSDFVLVQFPFERLCIFQTLLMIFQLLFRGLFSLRGSIIPCR
jgi:hypothetical protein